jgi:hypothetical protein
MFLPQPTDLDPAGDLAGLATKYWGQAGVIIVALGATVIHLYRRVEKIQEKRIEENKENAVAMAELVRELDSTVSELTHTIQQFVMNRKSGG